MPDEQQYSRKGCQGYSDNKLSQQCETIKNNFKRQITIWSLLKRETIHNRRDWGGSLVCSVTVRYQLEYAPGLGCKTETIEESPEEK